MAATTITVAVTSHERFSTGSPDLVRRSTRR